MSSSIRRRRSVRRRHWRDDFGATTGHSGQLDVGSSSQGRLERHSDRDWFGINLNSGSIYQVDLKGESLLDPHLRLRDSRGRVLTDIDDTPTSLNPSLQFNDEAGSDQRDLLRTLLASNHFSYFELDQAIQLDVVNA